MHGNVVRGDDQKHTPGLPVQGLVQAPGQVGNIIPFGQQQQGGTGRLDIFDAPANGSPGLADGPAMILHQNATEHIKMLFEFASQVKQVPGLVPQGNFPPGRHGSLGGLHGLFDFTVGGG